MKQIIIKWGEGHILQCDICFQMLCRGYTDESDYWDGVFGLKRLKPIKFKIIKGYGKDKGKEIKVI